MTAIVIDNITIRQDGEGRFNLNDLHQAAGGEPRHKPWQFLALNYQGAVPVDQVKGRNPCH